MTDAERFIFIFKRFHPIPAENMFMCGNCYYFAVSLKARFKDAVIKYLMVDNHFVTEIDGRLYDIRGDVTDKVDTSQMINWDDMEAYDELLYKRIIRDCIEF